MREQIITQLVDAIMDLADWTAGAQARRRRVFGLDLRIAPDTATERAGLVMMYLTLGQRLTVTDVENMTGLTRYSATRLLRNLAAKLPVYECDDGHWEMLIINRRSR